MAFPTEEEIREALRTVEDPEIRMSIIDLGLVYGVETDEEKNQAHVTMSLTTPACPLGDHIAQQVREALGQLGIDTVEVDIVWEPRWTPEMMSEEAKTALRWSGFNV